MHQCGQCCDMDAILARCHNVAVVEDACHAVGAEFRGRKAGSFGISGCFSFYEQKNISTLGEEEMIVTNDPAIFERVALYRSHCTCVYGKSTNYCSLDAARFRIGNRFWWRDFDDCGGDEICLLHRPKVCMICRNHAAWSGELRAAVCARPLSESEPTEQKSTNKLEQCPRMKRLTTSLAIFTVALLVVQSTVASTIWVTSTADDGTDGTLRAALAAADDGDTILFDVALPASIELEGVELEVAKNVTIQGPGAAQLTVSGERLPWCPVFYIAPGNTVTISGLTIAYGSGYYWGFFGGGVYNDCAALEISNCILRDNVAVQGGAVYNNAYSGAAAALMIANSILTCNQADYDGGAIYNRAESADATLTIVNSTLSGNDACGTYGGGAICNAGLDGGTATLTTVNSTLSNNSACAFDARTGGGAVLSYGYHGTATMTCENTTFNDNVAGDYGGAIWNLGASGKATLALKNCTLSGSLAVGEPGGDKAGAIFNSQDPGSSEASLVIDNCTFAGNSLDGVYTIYNEGGTLAMRNSILDAYTEEGSLSLGLFNSDGTVTSHGYNLSTDAESDWLTAEGDQVNSDPMLGLLQDNGGPTFTHALLPGSPAIDRGSSTDIAGHTVTTDQRGVTRPQGVASDIGAFELVTDFTYSWSGILPPIKPDGTSVFKAGSTIPVKFVLTGISAGITDLVATLSYAPLIDGMRGAVGEACSKTGGGVGNQFRYDPAADQYVFNWSTKGLSAGSYRLFISLGDGVERTVDLRLK